MTTCNLYRCQREEQCDDCFMVDHQKECGWCTMYDHTVRKLEVKWSDNGKMKQVLDNVFLK